MIKYSEMIQQACQFLAKQLFIQEPNTFSQLMIFLFGLALKLMQLEIHLKVKQKTFAFSMKLFLAILNNFFSRML